MVAVHFQSPALATTWIDDQNFQYEVWTDADRDLAVYYGAAADRNAFIPDRVTVVLDADGEWLLEYTSNTSSVGHTDDVLADCQALFGE